MYFSNYNFINNRFFCGGIKVTRNFKWVTISLSFWAYSGITVLYSNLSKHDLTRNIREDLPACWSQLRPRLDKLRGCTLSTFHNTAESPSTTDRKHLVAFVDFCSKHTASAFECLFILIVDIIAGTWISLSQRIGRALSFFWALIYMTHYPICSNPW